MLTSHELFGFMSPALAGEILNFTFESEKPAYKAALAAVAQARHVRPVFMERQPRATRDAAIIATLAKPHLEPAAGALLRVWLVKKQGAMLVEFMEALGLPHENGAVDDLPPTMDDAKLKAGVDRLLGKFPPEAVAVYLNAFNEMNQAGWNNLQAMLESDPRLQLGKAA